jgi:Peptidase inhibitor I78 family
MSQFFKASFAVLLACSSLACVSQTPSNTQTSESRAATCAANELQYLVGQPRTVLYTMRFAATVRIEEPGQFYTQEYRAERTRIIIDASGKITSVICG